MKYGTIYKIKNLVNGKEYVGQTTASVSSRFADHCSEKRNRHISNAIRQYGKENFEVQEIASAFDKESLNDLEVYFVEFFGTMYPNGYNHRAGGNQNGKCSDELRKKISVAKTGKIIPSLHNRDIPTKQRIEISRTLGGQRIVGVSIKDGSLIVYETAHSTKIHGHNPSNVVQICKKNGRRTISKGYKFFYLKDYANQSGSTESNILGHAQRIGIETT